MKCAKIIDMMLKLEDGGLNRERVREIVGILLESNFYLDLDLKERYGLIRRLLHSCTEAIPDSSTLHRSV